MIMLNLLITLPSVFGCNLFCPWDLLIIFTYLDNLSEALMMTKLTSVSAFPAPHQDPAGLGQPRRRHRGSHQVADPGQEDDDICRRKLLSSKFLQDFMIWTNDWASVCRGNLRVIILFVVAHSIEFQNIEAASDVHQLPNLDRFRLSSVR